MASQTLWIWNLRHKRFSNFKPTRKERWGHRIKNNKIKSNTLCGVNQSRKYRQVQWFTSHQILSGNLKKVGSLKEVIAKEGYSFTQHWIINCLWYKEMGGPIIIIYAHQGRMWRTLSSDRHWISINWCDCTSHYTYISCLQQCSPKEHTWLCLQ